MARAKYICNAKNKSEHCTTNCFHGIPHYKSRMPDANCENIIELCGLSNNKRKVRVHCKKLSNKELKKTLDI